MTALATRPVETPAEAAEFARLLGGYRLAGLCQTCAAQAAYGNQLGFSNVRQPCATCLPVVSRFPSPAVGAWRRHSRATLATLRAAEVARGTSGSPSANPSPQPPHIAQEAA